MKPDDPSLTAYVLGELDEQESRSIELAIDASLELQATVAAIRETTAMLRDGFRAEAIVGLHDEQKAAITRNTESSQASPAFILNHWAWLVVAACAVALAIPFLFPKVDKSQHTAMSNAKASQEVIPDETPSGELDAIPMDAEQRQVRN